MPCFGKRFFSLKSLSLSRVSVSTDRYTCGAILLTCAGSLVPPRRRQPASRSTFVSHLIRHASHHACRHRRQHEKKSAEQSIGHQWPSGPSSLPCHASITIRIRNCGFCPHPSPRLSGLVLSPPCLSTFSFTRGRRKHNHQVIKRVFCCVGDDITPSRLCARGRREQANVVGCWLLDVGCRFAGPDQRKTGSLVEASQDSFQLERKRCNLSFMPSASLIPESTSRRSMQ